MAIIPLRVYIHEIEELIDSGQLDEAVAHCRHILSTFPKHIASYRLLGKAHLEQQRSSDATDLFQRVLSAIPDDVTANVGMSMIREDENNLDAAIWHMELAYEAQSSNIAIQDELRRLYGRRDGAQPQKIRLTRGALARMYAKGGLHDQAVAELHAALSEDPNRHDLQLLLAELYFQVSQKVEAVETCANLLKKLPFCLVANQILSVCLPEKGATETAKNYRQIAISMDPYFAFVDRDAITAENVPDSAVNIEKLEWKPGAHAKEGAPQPTWATTLGISLEEPANEQLPDWMINSGVPNSEQPAQEPQQNVSSFIWDTPESVNPITNPTRSEEELPDWMKDAGWQPSSGTAPVEPPTERSEPLPADPPQPEPTENAEIPDWLKDIASEEIPEDKPQAGKDDIALPWLEQKTPGPTDSIIHWLEEKKPETNRPPDVPESAFVESSTEEEIPAWLKDLEAPVALPEEEKPQAETTPQTPAIPAFLEDLPEFEAPESVQAFSAPLEEIPATPEAASEPVEDMAQPVQEEEVPSESLDELPDWIKELANVGHEPAEPAIPVEQKGVFSAGDTLGILEEAPSSFIEEPSLGLPFSDVVVPAEEAPDVTLSDAVEMPISEIEPAGEEAPTAIIEENVVEAFPAFTETIIEEPKQSEKSIIDLGITPPHGLAIAELEETAPEQVEATGELTPLDLTPVVEEQLHQETEVDEPLAFEGITAPPVEADTLAWLEELANEQPASAEETEEAKGTEGILEAEGIEKAEEGEPPEETNVSLDWIYLESAPPLEDVSSQLQAEPEEAPAVPAEDIPDWIKGLGELPDISDTPSDTLSDILVTPPPEVELPKAEEIPSWLIELEQPEEKIEDLAPQEFEWKEDELPQWIEEITRGTPVEGTTLEQNPVIDEALPATSETAQEWIAEEPQLSDLDAEIHVETETQENAWVTEVEAISQPTIEALPEEEPLPSNPIEEMVAKVLEIPAEPVPDQITQLQEANRAALEGARNAVAEGQPSQAVEAYSGLIKQDYELDVIIQDLQEALYRFPVDVNLWISLGDAYFRTHELQEALNTYTKAEELSR